MPQARLENINPNEVLMYLGYHGGEVPAELEAQIASCAEDVKKAARPKVTYRIFRLGKGAGADPELRLPTGITGEPDGPTGSIGSTGSARPKEQAVQTEVCRGSMHTDAAVRLRETPGTYLQDVNFLLQGNDICRHLADCTHAILMAATLGPDVETLLMRAQVQDMSRALILDSCASCAIENVCDLFETDLREEYESQGKYLTDRFSPGYGDMPIGQQRDFCELLDTRRRIGLTVSQSGIMLPRKSVTAVMGASDTPRMRRSSGCANCSMFRDCLIRKDGRFCSNGG